MSRVPRIVVYYLLNDVENCGLTDFYRGSARKVRPAAQFISFFIARPGRR